MDRLEVAPLPGTEGTAPIAFSVDGESILVQEVRSSTITADGTLKWVPLAVGPTTPVGEGGGGAARGPDDDTIIIGGTTGLRLLHVLDGRVESLTTPVGTELGHFFPTLLPDGRTVLFHASTGSAATSHVAVYDLESGKRTNLIQGTTPSFASTGHLIFWRDGSLWAVPFDPDSLVVGSNPTVVVEGVARHLATAAGYAISDSGTLAYRLAETQTLGWVNRDGEMTMPVVAGGEYSSPRLSPLGDHVVFLNRADDNLWRFLTQMYARFSSRQVGQRRGKTLRMCSCPVRSGAVVCRSIDGRLRGPRSWWGACSAAAGSDASC